MLQAGEVLEEGCRFSASRLWSLQRRFYEHQGASAWSSGTIPFGVTNNPVVGGTYARLLAGFLRDVRTQLDPDHPINVLEIGGGCGQGAFHFLRQWQLLASLPALRGLKVRYILSDFAEANLAAYQAHPCLQPYLEDGTLDVALFDAEKDRQLLLWRSGEEIQPGSCPNPMVFIVNYVFDSLRHDVFWVEQGQLLDGQLRLVCRDQAQEDDPELVTHLDLHYDKVPVQQPYPNPAWNAVLEFYRSRLEDTSVCFPCGPALCLQGMLELSGGRMLLLSMDKAYDHLEDFVQLPPPQPVLHGGAFSLMANFHALELLICQVGGCAIHSQKRSAFLEISAFMAFRGRTDFPELAVAFEDCIERVGPVDLFQLRNEIRRLPMPPSVGLCLDLLRFSGWDPEVLRDFGDFLLGVEGTSEAEKEELQLALTRVLGNLFPVGVDIRESFAMAVAGLGSA